MSFNSETKLVDITTKGQASYQVDAERSLVSQRATSESSKTDAQVIKPVPSAKDTAKLALGQDAVPAIPEEMSNMDSYQDDMDAVMAEEGITEEQMAMVDSGPLAEAQQGRAELREKVANAPTEMQEGARKQAKTVESEMDKEEEQATKAACERPLKAEMKNKRKEEAARHAAAERPLEMIHGEKQKTKTKLEEEREKEIGTIKQIQSMYQTTEDNVKTRLNNLEKDEACRSSFRRRFAKAVVKFTEEFKTEVDTKVNAFLDERHSGWFGWARAAKDWLLGVDEMPEVKEAFETANEEQATKAACENPLKTIDTEIKSIIQYNNKVIQECKADLKKGKEEEARNTQLPKNKFVKTLKPNLQDAGKAAAKEMAKKFEELDTFINEKQKALVDKLCAMKDKAIEHIDKVAEKNVSEARRIEEALSGALSQLIGLVVAALLKFFNWALGLFGYGMENLEETIVRTKRTLTFMVKHPIDFMAGLFQAVGMGFTQFGDNIQKHLVSGLVMWLTGGMREEPIRLPDKWDLKGILFFIMEVLGLGWANLRKKLVKHVGEQAMGLAEKGLDIVMKLFTEGPIAMWDKFRGTQEFEKPLKRCEELKGEIFAAVREMMIIEIIKQGVIFLLSLTNPASGIVKAIKAIYDFVMWFFNNIHRIIEMVKKVFEASANIVKGNLGGAANAIERIMGLTIPVNTVSSRSGIDLFLSILGLSGLPKKVMAVIKRVGGKLNALIDKLLLKVVGVIKKMFGKGKKRGGKTDPAGKKEAAGKKKTGKTIPFWNTKEPFVDDEKQGHKVYYKGKGGSAILMVASENPSPVSMMLAVVEKKIDQPENKRFKKYFTKTRTLNTEIEGHEGKLTNKSLSDVIRQKEYEKLSSKMKKVAKNLTHLMPLVGDGPVPPKAILPKFQKGVKGKSFEAMFIHNVKPNQTPDGQEASANNGSSLPGWKELEKVDPDSGRSIRQRDSFVKMHLLHKDLGGKAADSNLTSMTTGINTRFYNKVEEVAVGKIGSGPKAEPKEQQSPIWYKVTVDYHDSGPVAGIDYSNYLKSFRAKYGTITFDQGKWNKGKQVEIFSEDSIPVPQFVGANEKVFNVNTDGATTLAKLKVRDLQMPSNIATLIRSERLEAAGLGKSKPYADIGDLVGRLSQRLLASDRPIANFEIGIETLRTANRDKRISF